ncbi:MAG TPA: hypothetical protein VLI71_06795 [Gammaproteobacteria bacterium]|nr:hypothetical protein [Gammaproteobacteria bacterium]
MQQRGTMQRFRTAASKTWLGAALAVSLLLAESFAFTHELDTATHANGEVCAVCVSAASFGAANAGAALRIEPAIATSFVVAAAGIVFLSVVPTRPYARGPPSVSFTF